MALMTAAISTCLQILMQGVHVLVHARSKVLLSVGGVQVVTFKMSNVGQVSKLHCESGVTTSSLSKTWAGKDKEKKRERFINAKLITSI